MNKKYQALLFLVSASVMTSTMVSAMGKPTQDKSEGGPVQITKCQTIDSSGSYVVTKNLAASGDCLVITTDSVTLDLAGFVLSGDGTGSGVMALWPTPGIALLDLVVRNGTVTGFENGIDFDFASGAIVEQVRALGNAVNGISMNRGIVAHCIAHSNGDDGIVCGGLCNDNVATGNGGDGIAATNATTVMNNSATGNGDEGIEVSGSSSTVMGNLANNNAGDGISVVCPGNVIGNLATNSGGQNLALFFSANCNVDNNVAP